MRLERVQGGSCRPPFPIHADLPGSLLAAHRGESGERDATTAHVLGTCAAYSYADLATVSMMMARLGLAEHASVRIAQTVDAMFIFSTAFLVQSRCGRVVILCYRGTEPTNLAHWLGDADIGSDAITIGGRTLVVHAGFYRNVRATRWAVLEELQHALDGRSLHDPSSRVDHPMEALYVTGHSLGGAMAALFALTVTAEQHPVADQLRAIYTFGAPMAISEPLSGSAGTLGRKLFRHITARDIVPSLPPAPWGRFAHSGHEYHFTNGAWERAVSPVEQLVSLREVPRSLLAFFATAKRRNAARYSMAEHGPHHYLAALRPKGRVSEFGDQG